MIGQLNEPGFSGSMPIEPAPSSGEGAGTALEALIKKRKLRAKDDPPSADSDRHCPDDSAAL